MDSVTCRVFCMEPQKYAPVCSANEQGVKFNQEYPVSEIIYHYTDIGACQSMIEHNQFWLSAHSFMNDEKEYYEGLDILECKLDSYIGTVGTYSKDTTQELISHVKEVMIYSTSFSKESDLLSQWRSYCPIEGGVAIGFDKHILESVLCGR